MEDVGNLVFSPVNHYGYVRAVVWTIAAAVSEDLCTHREIWKTMAAVSVREG